jgi:hypothetical protein
LAPSVRRSRSSNTLSSGSKRSGFRSVTKAVKSTNCARNVRSKSTLMADAKSGVEACRLTLSFEG